MLGNEEEFNFLLENLKKNYILLEYGSGESTVQLSNFVKKIVSVEHNIIYAEKLLKTKPNNCTLLYVTPNLPFEEGTENCGKYEEFKDYIEAPNNLNFIFDVVFIDGRARTCCAKNSLNLTHEKSLFFIHDYERTEYHTVEQYLKLISKVGRMAMFEKRK